MMKYTGTLVAVLLLATAGTQGKPLSMYPGSPCYNIGSSPCLTGYGGGFGGGDCGGISGGSLCTQAYAQNAVIPSFGSGFGGSTYGQAPLSFPGSIGSFQQGTPLSHGPTIPLGSSFGDFGATSGVSSPYGPSNFMPMNNYGMNYGGGWPMGQLGQFGQMRK